MNLSIKNKKILIAPLNWGLGHATRCIPVINALIKEGFEPILASDGDALKLLQKEYPHVKCYELPAYDVQYATKGNLLKYKLLLQVPKILKAVQREKRFVANIIKTENISGIVSDNRFGFRSDKVPSVYLTHQINVLSGSTTFFTSFLHQKIISKFDECWVPDYKDAVNLAGELSHDINFRSNIKYIDPISRFDKKSSSKEGASSSKKYDIMVLLSGPEPQRTILEKKLLKEFQSFAKKMLFVRGVFSEKKNNQHINSVNNENMKVVDFLMQKELEEAILQSELIIARSGYSTIMDLERLNAKTFFIPTPGQFEQEYLAKYLEQQSVSPFAIQDEFNRRSLEGLNNYNGFRHKKTVKENQFPFTVFY